MGEPAVACRDVRFAYARGAEVLAGLSLEVPEGQLVGLLGPNGAGKTTLVRLMVGLLRPDRGAVRVFGQDPFRNPGVRRLVGVMHQAPGFENFLSGWDNLYLYGRFVGLSARAVRKRVEELSGLFGPMPYLKQDVITLSGGQRRRLQVVRTLLHEPRLAFLDEPTVALDVDGRQQFYRAVRELAARTGATVVWTSHYLEEIERNCQRVVILLGGRVVFDEAASNLGRVAQLEEITVDIDPATAAAAGCPGLEAAAPGRLVYKGLPEEFYRDVLPRLIAAGVRVRGVSQAKLGLEDIYLRVVRSKEVARP